jgi:hypothetical protein
VEIFGSSARVILMFKKVEHIYEFQKMEKNIANDLSHETCKILILYCLLHKNGKHVDMSMYILQSPKSYQFFFIFV